MTITEAKQAGHCIGCIYRLVGPGPMQCIGTQSGDTECPGRAGSPKREGGDK